jgi:H+/Cl- antiporter ClcA
MAWRIGSTIVIVVFVLVVTWMALTGPLVEVGDAFKDLQTSGQFNTDDKIDGYISGWLTLFPVAIFGLILWGMWYVYRKELTRSGL